MSPWLRENGDLRSGRIPLVLESVGGVPKTIAQRVANGVQGAGRENCRERGWQGGNPLSLFLQLETSRKTLEVRLGHSGLSNATVEP